MTTTCDQCQQEKDPSCREGWVTDPENPRDVSRCPKAMSGRAVAGLQRANIPTRFRDATVSGYNIDRSPILKAARTTVVNYVTNFELGTTTWGILFYGPPGTGKTHLAVAAMNELVKRHALSCAFFDFTELLMRIQATFGNSSSTTTLDIVQPVKDVDILVLDELGGAKPTEWALDILYSIVNGRYGEGKATMFTTNYPIARRPSFAGDRAMVSDRPKEFEAPLSDRVGGRIVSRLSEMSIDVSTEGAGDYRQKLRPKA